MTQTSAENRTILVTGAGGVIGGHLTAELPNQGHAVKAVDQKPFDQWYQSFGQAENFQKDCSRFDDCRVLCADVDENYNLAADMGGRKVIEAKLSGNHSWH